MTKLIAAVTITVVASACIEPVGDVQMNVDDLPDMASRDDGAVDTPATIDQGCVPEPDGELCSAAGLNCGLATLTDRCGSERSVECGACVMPDVCGGDDVENVCGCAPDSDEDFCQRFDAECGALTQMDRCDRQRNVMCGTCDAPNECISNICGCNAESAEELCQRVGATCGQITEVDNCGQTRTVSCGTCPTPQTCGGDGVANQCGCTRESGAEFCARLVKNCQVVTAVDNCGVPRSENCGSCTAPAECGGGGTANVCACPGETDLEFCSRHGAACGALTATDVCGQMRTVDCGSCPAQQVCGGGGTANQCGCTPETDAVFCQRAGATCESVTQADNCGTTRTAQCGTCTSPETCNANVCSCSAESDAEFCARNGASCGGLQALDNCGLTRTADCGVCPAGEMCSGNQCSCSPESDAQFCARNNGECGTLTATDNCGASRTANCGTCPSGVCSMNSCDDCLPETNTQFCARLGASCDGLSGTDNCGNARTVASCGTCSSGFQCIDNDCVCNPPSDAAFCSAAGAECGMYTGVDNCGVTRTADCGSCPMMQGCNQNTCQPPEAICADMLDNDSDGAADCADDDCDGEGCSLADPTARCYTGACCTPETDAEFCARLGTECGQLQGTDNCGETRNVSCGSCSNPLNCQQGQCICTNCNPTACETQRCDASDPLRICVAKTCI